MTPGWVALGPDCWARRLAKDVTMMVTGAGDRWGGHVDGLELGNQYVYDQPTAERAMDELESVVLGLVTMIADTLDKDVGAAQALAGPWMVKLYSTTGSLAWKGTFDVAAPALIECQIASFSFLRLGKSLIRGVVGINGNPYTMLNLDNLYVMAGQMIVIPGSLSNRCALDRGRVGK